MTLPVLGESLTSATSQVTSAAPSVASDECWPCARDAAGTTSLRAAADADAPAVVPLAPNVARYDTL